MFHIIYNPYMFRYQGAILMEFINNKNTSAASLNLCTGRLPTGVMIPDAV